MEVKKIECILASASVWTPAAEADLLEDVLFSHEFLSLAVGFAHDDVQHRLAAVDDVGHEENHVLQ